MKKIIMLIFCISIAITGKSKSTYYYALELNKFQKDNVDGKIKFHKTETLELTKIIKGFASQYRIDVNKLFSDLANNSNPFIGIPFSAAQSQNEQYTSLGGLLPTSILSSIGNLDVTNFADGMAKFIVKRTKQELSTAFFERFKQDLDNTKQIQILFPATYNALKAIDQELYNYSGYLDLLRESFQKDLVLILPDITKLINDPCMNDVFNKHPEIKSILSDALYITNEFSQGKHPGEIIHDYATSQANNDLLNKIEPNLSPSLQALDLFSQSLQSKQANQYWISPDSLKLLFDDTTFHIYLGLIYEQATLKNKIAFNGVDFTEKLKEADSKIELYKIYLTNLISKASSTNYYFKAIKDKQDAGKDKPTYQDYYSLFDASLNLFEYLADTPTLVNLQALNITDTTKLNSYFKSIRSLGNIYVDIYEKQYTSAIVELCNTDSNLINSKVASLILKYGSFAGSLVKAENSDDVQNAIEAVALPSGSSRIKRESECNISLNAYCGISGGMEKGIDNKYKFNILGVSAPIGISFSKGHSFLFFFDTGKYSWSSSIFISIIDLGAPTAFRFTNSTDSVPAIKLKDIISPGVFISLGIPKSPISINIGCQKAPLLSTVSTSGNTFGTNTLRFTVGVCIDLPILTLYNKSR